MKELKYIYILFCVTFLSCQHDFNPIIDSSFRDIHFHVCPKNVFSQILLYSDSNFVLCDIDTFPENSLFRINSYCYDESGNLVRSSSCIADDFRDVDICIHRLDTTRIYSVLFLADFVKKGTSNSGFESSWFYLNKMSLESFYMSRYLVDEDLFSGTVLAARWQGNPSLAIDTVDLEPITLNSYFCLKNIRMFDEINLYIAYAHSSYLWSGASLSSSLEFDKQKSFYPIIESKEIVVPIQYSCSNDAFGVRLFSRSVNSIDSLKTVVRLTGERRPFVCYVDCEKMVIEDVQFY